MCLTVLATSVAAHATPSKPAVGASPVGATYLEMLGPHAGWMLAPSTGRVGALVALPRGASAQSYGLDAVAPGIGRIRTTPDNLRAFASAHPELRVEVAPPLKPLMDRTGQWVGSILARQQRGASGKKVMIGVADTGLDVTHKEFRDANGKSRVAWMLDLSLVPLGGFPKLESQFGIKDESGKVAAGAVFDKAMIDELLADIDAKKCVEPAKKCAPTDEVGHGTHVTGIAASSGLDGKFAGVAPEADIVFVRVTRGRDEGIENDDLVRAVQFMFDRADNAQQPMVVNLSLGSDFGPHDGTFLWEQVVASYIGPDHPGHAIVAAAGNSGSIVEQPIHQSVRVTKGSRMRVPISTQGADAGAVQIWITLRPGADLKIGLEAPDGEWIEPIAAGRQSGKNTAEYNAGVIYGSTAENSPIPNGSNGAVVVWTGKWPSGQYAVTLEGAGMAELYLQGLGDATLGTEREAVFNAGVREGTVNLPATHPNIIGVGCTVNRPKWSSLAGVEVGLRVPKLDEAGGLPGPRRLDGRFDSRDLIEGEMCWFSSAGPTAAGVPKPEIAAPGALVVSAMSRSAKPGVRGSIFTNTNCPKTADNKEDIRCLQIDADHGISVGTSMSSPVVAGVIAMLLQQDPTLTQEQVIGLLQAGAHRFRGPAAFLNQSGPGEVDAWGSLDALDQMKNPRLFLPHASQSWLTLSADYVAADGSTPLTAIIELRTEDGQHRADLFEGNRLQPLVLVDNVRAEVQPTITRRAPGVYVYAWKPPTGFGGQHASFGATFDGLPIVAPKKLPIAADSWNAAYPSSGGGSGCSVQPSPRSGPLGARLAVFGLVVASLLAARRRSTRSRSRS